MLSLQYRLQKVFSDMFTPTFICEEAAITVCKNASFVVVAVQKTLCLFLQIGSINNSGMVIELSNLVHYY